MSQPEFPGSQPPPERSSPYASPMSRSVSAGPGAPYKDRTVGLVVFGILEIVLGALCALLVPLMVLSVAIRPAGGAAMDPRMMIPGMMMYVVMAVVLIWLGIGSVRCRRWARALNLVLGWLWLVAGIMGIGFFIALMSGTFGAMAQQGGGAPREVLLVAQAFMFGVAGCIYVVIPGALVLFHQSRHVRATCEAKDPHVRWTDRCPLPVLAASVVWTLAALCMPWSLCYGGVFPLFGVLMRGLPAALAILAWLALAAYLAWGTYRLKMTAWWGSIALVVVGTASVVVTFTRMGMAEFYRAANIPPEQLKLMEQTGMLERMDALMPWIASVSAMVFVGYLLFIKRYFARAAGAG